jgi:polar amino acid transport system permease protein
VTFRLDVIWKEWLQFALGLGNTVWLCAVSMLLSLLLGVLFVVPLMSRRRYVRVVARMVVDSGRCIPFLLLTYLVYYALPSLGLSLDKWTAALITLVLYNTATWPRSYGPRGCICRWGRRKRAGPSGTRASDCFTGSSFLKS